MADSTVTIVGNLTRDPELRFTPSGRAVVNFGVAVNRRYQANNEWQEEVSFFDVAAWAQTAENIAESFSKGDRVIVFGRLQQRSWENDAGEKRSKVEVVADEVGASVRFATVEMTKNEKAGSSTRQPATAGASSGPAYEYDEEAF